jgi:hypothetical protein
MYSAPWLVGLPLAALLTREAERTEMPRASTLDQARQNFDAFVKKFSELDQMSSPLTQLEEDHPSLILLPRADELISHFINGLLASAHEVGQVVNIIRSCSPARFQNLQTVINIAITQAGNVPSSLLSAPPPGTLAQHSTQSWPSDQTRVSAPYVVTTPPPPTWMEGEDAGLHTMQNQGRFNRRPFPATAGSPAQNRRYSIAVDKATGLPLPSDRFSCGVCYLHDPSKAKGHTEKYCPRAVEPLDPKNPAKPRGPANFEQIAMAFVQAYRQAARQTAGEEKPINTMATHQGGDQTTAEPPGTDELEWADEDAYVLDIPAPLN